MLHHLPSVYPVTDRSLSGLGHREMVERLAAGGATLVQLRDKTAAARDFYEATRDALAFARPRGILIIVNDRVDIARAAEADGVHLGQDDLPPAEARAILGPHAIIGFSTHSVEQAVSEETAAADYIAIGPVFATRTKENPDPVVGLAGVMAVRRRIRKPLVAIGGVTAANAPDVFAAGADAVAVISELFAAPEETSDRMRALLSLSKRG
jgi:thiamine-phosphate pyrophosphorylase